MNKVTWHAKAILNNPRGALTAGDHRALEDALEDIDRHPSLQSLEKVFKRLVKLWLWD